MYYHYRMIKKGIDILVIDDDPDLCQLMEMMLKVAGFTTTGCNNPLFIQNVLETIEPRAILMDMLLSGTDGRDICRVLKSSAETKHKMIIMTSAHPDAEKTCREAGADDFLAKPFDMDILIKKVTDIINKISS
ncbi:N/A [soil metagenome]